MDYLKNKRYNNYNYISRYTIAPVYYHTKDQKEVSGLVKNMLKNNTWVAHKVVITDTLDSLALTYYNNPSYWWVIAYFNDIQDAFINLKDYYNELKIPSISSLEFGDLR